MSANKIKEPLIWYTSKVRLWEFLENQQRFLSNLRRGLLQSTWVREGCIGPYRYKINNTVTIVTNDNNSVLILITTCKLNMTSITYLTEYFYSTLMIELVLRNV